MRWLSMALLWPVLAMAGMPEAPAPLELTADEAATVADRDVAIRMDDTDGGGVTVGIIEVNAPVGRTMDAILDLPPRVDESGALKSVQISNRTPASGSEPEKMDARFQLRVMGTNVVFHLNYQIDRPGLWAVSTLDTSKENDVESVYASYQVFPTPSGGSRIVYRSQTETGRSVPQWIKRWLANNALKDQLTGIRARAEGT